MASVTTQAPSELQRPKTVKRPRVRKLADVIRYDNSIIYPAKGEVSSDHVTLHHVEEKSFWVLSAAGREQFTKEILATGIYAANHPHLEALKKKHPEITLPVQPHTVKFQIVNLLVAHRDFGFTREDLEAFNVAIHQRSGELVRISQDVVQAARHTEQWGVERIGNVTVDGERVYLLHDTLRFYPLYRKTEQEAQNMDRAEAIAHQKRRAQRIIDTPDDQWDIAHTRPGGTAVTVQPNWMNRSSRDEWMYDQNGDRLFPTAQTVVRKMLRHYTDEELAAVSAALVDELQRALVRDGEDSE